MGSFRGSLASVPATQLGSVAIRGAVDRAGRRDGSLRSADGGAAVLNPLLDACV